MRPVSPDASQTEVASADELSSLDEQLLAFIQWTGKYRLGRDLEDGTWVKYETIGEEPQQEIEMRITEAEEGGFWLTETHRTVETGATTELHLLLDAGKMGVTAAFRVDEKGNREEITPLTARRVAEIVFDHRLEVVGDTKAGERWMSLSSCPAEELTGACGSLVCSCVQAMVVDSSADALLSRTRQWIPEGTKIHLANEVPRLMPFAPVLTLALITPDDFMSRGGGLVRSDMYELIDFSGREQE